MCDDATSEAAKRGYMLFSGRPFECFHCHVGFNLTDSVHWRGKPDRGLVFHNTGLYNVDGQGGYPAVDPGLAEMTLDPDDTVAFLESLTDDEMLTDPALADAW